MLKQVLFEMNKDLSQYIGHSKIKLMEGYIAERLNKCLQQYYDEINSSVSYLKDREPINLSRRINRSL